jgi:hypothetical protein
MRSMPVSEDDCWPSTVTLPAIVATDRHVTMTPSTSSSSTSTAANPCRSSRREEVLDGVRRHLNEVAQRRFASVGLPIRIRHETHGGIERKVRCGLRGSKSLRIEGKNPLDPLEHVGQKEADHAECQ